MEQGNLRVALRERTRQLHARLDASLAGPQGRVTDLPGYVRLLRGMHALHAVADGPLAQWVGSSPLASTLTTSRLPDRAPSYAADLAVVGAPVPDAEPIAGGATDRPAGDTGDARGLALLYLLSGSAAGARVLLRRLPAAVPAEARRGLTDAAAPASTRLWRDACALLQSEDVPRRLHEATVDEANAVMAWLVGRAQPVAP